MAQRRQEGASFIHNTESAETASHDLQTLKDLRVSRTTIIKNDK